mmetsp:Transcript_106657/g.296837  ORF Transcript_106657/g.296837 Transcript_106657/m.296837 type:complete len:538 (+) Transcript_106657:122-1735(+)
MHYLCTAHHLVLVILVATSVAPQSGLSVEPPEATILATDDGDECIAMQSGAVAADAAACSVSWRQLRGELRTKQNSFEEATAELDQPDAPGSASCFLLAPDGTPAPLDDEELATVRKYFLRNIDVNGTGAVVAAPDHDTGPGGNYYYHWERDAALSMHALMVTAGSLAEVDEHMKHYVKWVKTAQGQPTMHSGTDPRTEPKYEIPNATIVKAAWCRPQTDGPGLRAKTLSEYALALLQEGDETFVRENFWATNSTELNKKLISYDLDWVVHNWQQDSCDLWEEIVSGDFFWGRYTMRAGLFMGAQLASALGDQQAYDLYMGTKKEIESKLMDHWTGTYVDQCRNYSCEPRRKDSAVIEAFNVGDLDDGVFSPLSKYVLGTVVTLNELFCKEYAINRADTSAGMPGIMYGRYSGDHYNGGNPWVLLSASLARLIYRQASVAAKSKEDLPAETYALLKKAYGIPSRLSGKALGDTLMRAADGVLLRVKRHLRGEELHMAEQLNRNEGSPSSAQDLTWNYANTLLAMKARADYVADRGML